MSGLRAILTYHSLDDSGSPISVRPSAFVAHMRSLAASHVRVLPLETLWDEVRGGTNAGDAVAITFDDGFANFSRHAAPVLEELGFPSTMFVVSRHVGGESRWADRNGDGSVPVFRLLDWDLLGKLIRSGVTVGAHTRRHVALGNLDLQSLEDEIAGSAEDIASRLGVAPRTFAYPYGTVSPSAIACVSRTFAVGVTTQLRALSPSDHSSALPRLDAYYLRRENGLSGWGSVRFAMYLRLRGLIRSARARSAAAATTPMGGSQ